jgi:hypothetical protein
LTIFSRLFWAIWWNFLGIFGTLDTLAPASPARPKGGQGANLVTLTTSNLWMGFLKFRRLDILEFAWLYASGSGLTEKITRNLKNPKTILSSENATFGQTAAIYGWESKCHQKIQ